MRITWESQSEQTSGSQATQAGYPPSASVPFQSLHPGTCYPGLSVGQWLLMPLGTKDRSEATSSSGIHLLPAQEGWQVPWLSSRPRDCRIPQLPVLPHSCAKRIQ